MPSHLKDEDERPPSVSLDDLKGNRLADELAGGAARRFALPLHVAGPYLYYARLVKRIQHRLTTVLISLPDRAKPKHLAAPVRIKRPPITELIEESQHLIHADSNRVGCLRCHNNFSAADPQLKQWLLTSCCAIATSSDRPVPLPFEELHIGNKFTHISHQLNKFRGLVYCRKCGCRAGRSLLRNLSGRCMPPSDYGLLSIQKLQDGKLPPGLTTWPDRLP